MTLLLDTHIWLWSALDPSRLSKRVKDALEDPSNELWLSPISVWETLVLIAPCAPNAPSYNLSGKFVPSMKEANNSGCSLAYTNSAIR